MGERLIEKSASALVIFLLVSVVLVSIPEIERVKAENRKPRVESKPLVHVRPG